MREKENNNSQIELVFGADGEAVSFSAHAGATPTLSSSRPGQRAFTAQTRVQSPAGSPPRNDRGRFIVGEREPLAERFWSKADVGVPDACWIWKGSLNNWGYGRFRLNGRARSAHTVSWALTRGDIPAGMCVLHDCPGGDNRACVNPAHLWLGTHADNMDDMRAKGRVYKGGPKSPSATPRPTDRPAPPLDGEAGP